MPTQSECPAPAAGSGSSPKLLRLLRKRLRQLTRVTLVLALALALAAMALALRWLTSLNGLPDIGDPFDVAEFRAFRVPDMEKALAAKFSPDAIAGIAVSPAELSSDTEASAEYRAHLIGVVAKRAVQTCK